MPKIILYIAFSLDGYMAEENGSVDWLSSYNEDYGYEKFLSTIDTIIMGKKTYQQVLSFGKWPYSGIKTYVLTHQKLKKDANVEFISGSIKQIIKTITNQSNKNIWLVGGGQVITEFVKVNLIDEFQIFIMPLFLGKGIPILHEPVNMDALKLIQSQSYENGVIEIHLEKKNE